MKNLFKLLLAGTFLFTFAAKSFSQTTANTNPEQAAITTEEKAAAIVTEMTKIATLTDAQAVQIKPLIIELLKQKEIDDVQYKGNEEALNTARKNRLSAVNTKIKTIVTEDQYAKIKEYWDNKKKLNNDQSK
jgi:hypothetical protein